MPPTLVFYGTGDRLIGEGRKFVKKMTAAGNTTELWVARNAGHGFFNNSPFHQSTLVKVDEVEFFSGDDLLNSGSKVQ